MKTKFKATKNTIKEYVNKWIKITGLGWWHIDVFYISDKKTIKKYFTDKAAGSTTLGRAYPDWKYLDAKILFNLRAMRKMENDKIEMVVLHELCHVLVNEMREGGIEHEERVVTTLAYAFLWVKDLT